MNKKFLSAILFGALMVTSTGTFVSCKDYDDDIDNINKELTDIKSQIAALQTKVNEGKWITNLAPTTGGFTVTFSDGTSYTIANGKDGAQGPAGAAGTSVEVKDGIWYIDGKATDYVAVTKDELGKVKVPFIKDGVWYFYNEAGEAVASTYKANGAAYAVNANGKYTLFIPDADGKMQQIELPTAASMISGLSVTETEIAINYFAFTPTAAVRKAWKGSRALTTDKYILAGKVDGTDLNVRIDPVNVDAKTIAFGLVDTKNGVPSKVSFIANENKGLLTKAAYGNGRYILTLKQETLKDDKALEDFENQFKKDGTGDQIIYALDAANSFRSEYQLPVAVAAATGKDYAPIYVNKAVIANNTVKVNTGDVNEVTVAKPANLYDMWLEVSDAYQTAFGIVIDQANATFQITKNPDEITAASFPMTIHSMDNEGAVIKTNITVQLSESIDSGAEYATVSHLVKATAAKNYFKADLSIMKTALGAALNTWKIKVDPTKTAVEVYKEETCKNIVATSGIAVKAVSEVVDKDFAGETKAATSTSNANFAKFYVTNADAATALTINTVYYAKVSFKNSNNEVINSIIVPFKLTVPTLSELFVPQTGVFVSDVANAYMDASATTTVVTPSYAVKGAFNEFKKNLGTSTFTAELDDKTKISGDKTSKALAEFSTTDITSTNVESLNITLKTTGAVTINETNKTPEGYKKELIAKFSNVKYLGLYSYEDEVYTFKIKVMSPILEGKVTAVGGEVIIPATDTDGYKVNDSHIKGYTYNDIKYGIFYKTATTTWARKEVKDVKFSVPSASENLFSVGTMQGGTAATTDTKEVPSYVVVTPKNLAATTSGNLAVTVTDAWGYVLPQTIKVTVKVGE